MNLIELIRSLNSDDKKLLIEEDFIGGILNRQELMDINVDPIDGIITLIDGRKLYPNTSIERRGTRYLYDLSNLDVR
jgi:hypothetical protein